MFAEPGFAHVAVGQGRDRQSATDARQAAGMGVARQMRARVSGNGRVRVQ